MTIPEKLTDFNVYREGEKLIGTDAEVQLPDFEAISSEVAGTGILGTVDSPTPGHFGSLTVGIKFRTISKEAAYLHEPHAHILTLRGNQRLYETGTGGLKDQAVKVVLRGLPKKLTGGTFKPGDPTGTQVDIEVTYIKIELDGEVFLELDKYNYVYVVNGIDYMAGIRNNI